MNTAETKSRDSFLWRLSEFEGTVPTGLTVFDVMTKDIRLYLKRVRMKGDSSEGAEQTFRTDPDELLCRGAAVGVCDDGLLRHFHSLNKPQKFAGFVMAMIEPGKCLVWCRGRTVLTVREVQISDIANLVYCVELDVFTLTPVSQLGTGAEMGRVVCLEDQSGCAVVAFKSADDDRALDLRISR